MAELDIAVVGGKLHGQLRSLTSSQLEGSVAVGEVESTISAESGAAAIQIPVAGLEGDRTQRRIPGGHITIGVVDDGLCRSYIFQGEIPIAEGQFRGRKGSVRDSQISVGRLCRQLTARDAV